MGQRTVTFAEGEYYHIYNRGNSKQTIFMDRADYKRFQQLLFIANATNAFTFRDAKKVDVYDFERGEQLVLIEAYCLMPNHFHILLSPNLPEGIQKFIQKLSTAYSMYFNKKHERTGGLFEGRFKSTHVDTDEYLRYLFSYIHLNPVKLIQSDWKEVGLSDYEKTTSFLKEYSYSSLVDVMQWSNREDGAILDQNIGKDYFQSSDEWLEDMEMWLTYQDLLTEAGPI